MWANVLNIHIQCIHISFFNGFYLTIFTCRLNHPMNCSEIFEFISHSATQFAQIKNYH